MSAMKLKSKSKTQLWTKVFSILFCISIIASLFLYITNNFIQSSEDLAPNEVFQKNSREYVGIWGLDQIDILEVTLDYHGKRPELPFENLSSFDEKKHNADWGLPREDDQKYYARSHVILMISENINIQPRKIYLRALSQS